MDKIAKSETLLESFLRNALARYAIDSQGRAFTDLYLQPNPQSGELVVMNDDDEVLSCIVMDDWKNYEGFVFYEVVGRILTDVLQKLQQGKFFEQLNLIRPYSVVLVDGDKETVKELLLIDDEETMLLNDGLMSGLDEELDAFLKELLES